MAMEALCSGSLPPAGSIGFQGTVEYIREPQKQAHNAASGEIGLF